mgnify:CR=1 FL=1
MGFGIRMMKRIAEYMAAIAFSVFFLLGGTGFTLSHYCCKQCKSMHNDAILTPDSTPAKDNYALCITHYALSKTHDCCWVRHFEVDTTETAPVFCLPDKAENDLFGSAYPPDIHLTSTRVLTDKAGTVYPPPLFSYKDHTKGVLQRVCRWLI